MKVRALTSADSAAVASWRYPRPYSTYDVDSVSTLASDHWAVTDADRLVGYCCFGAPARVAGADEEDGTLDVGYGLAPELMGCGHGCGFVEAILEFAADRFGPERFRLYVLDWNEPSRKVAERQGFAAASVLQNDEGSFRVMVRDA